MNHVEFKSLINFTSDVACSVQRLCQVVNYMVKCTTQIRHNFQNQYRSPLDVLVHLVYTYMSIGIFAHSFILQMKLISIVFILDITYAIPLYRSILQYFQFCPICPVCEKLNIVGHENWPF